MRKTFIEADTAARAGASACTSLPLMRKTFIEASRMDYITSALAQSLFRLCGRLSLRLGTPSRNNIDAWSLPLMRKTFIEANHDGELLSP